MAHPTFCPIDVFLHFTWCDVALQTSAPVFARIRDLFFRNFRRLRHGTAAQKANFLLGKSVLSPALSEDRTEQDTFLFAMDVWLVRGKFYNSCVSV